MVYNGQTKAPKGPLTQRLQKCREAGQDFGKAGAMTYGY